MEMMGCLHDAGLPAGVVNHVTGPGAELSRTFLNHPACRKLSFTGSTEVGRELIRGSADRVVRLSLELGGSAPVLIFPDVDVDRVARETVAAKFRNNGQVCIAATRFYAHDDIYDEYVERAAAYAAALKVGDPFAEGTNCGPVCDAAAAAKAESMVADAVAKGARVLTGGERPTGPGFERGFWYKPTVLVDVPPGARLTCEEVFGPVMPIFRFGSLEEGLRLANDTPYGLAGYVFTRDLQQAITVAEGLEFGIIGLNDMVPATAECPFGGMKESGQGREGGAEGIEDYLETKYVSVGMA
jgi:succinate-semialdehyde dehydrogenase/glutarate-semialdehyde dehydrogenase